MVQVQDQQEIRAGRGARRSCGGGRGCAAEGGLEVARRKGEVGRPELPSEEEEEEEGWQQRRSGSSRGGGGWACRFLAGMDPPCLPARRGSLLG